MMKDSDSVADSSSLIASLMEATGSPIENATLALQKCGGNKQKALELLLTGGGANFNDKQQSVSAGASKGAKLDENVEITKASMAQQDTASTAAAARGSQSTASVMRERGVPTPRPAQTTIFPGAVAVEGPGARGTDDQRTLSFTSSSGSNSMSNQPTEVKPTVTARLVIDNSEDHFESLEERIQRVEELQRRQEGIVIGQVLGADNEDGDEEEARSVASSNEDVTSLRASLFGSKRKMTIAVVLVLAVVAIIVGSVIATSSSNSQKDEAPPTAAPASTLSDLIELLSSVSFDNGTALQTRLTPQNDALNWLASNANLDTYSDEKRIQRYALAVLYYSTNGDSWYGKVGWLSNFDECDWYSLAEAGSLCDENGSVVELNFYNGDTETGNNEVGTIPIGNGNNIVGTIPNELALLSDSLASLTIMENGLTGTLPTSIGFLTQLTRLSLWRNSLVGTIPSQISLLTSLTFLGLWDNSLTGTIPSEVGTMTILTDLHVGYNSLMGTIPSQIGTMSAMKFLSLPSNSLTGIIPSQIAFLSNLYDLRLYENNFTGNFTWSCHHL